MITKLLQKIGYYGTCRYCGGATTLDIDRLNKGYADSYNCKSCKRRQ